MTYRVERFLSLGNTVVLKICGRIQAEHISSIKELIGQENGGVTLSLEEVTLIDREAVSFLAASEVQGIDLRNCPPFLREWITAEQLQRPEEP
jgi:hypothetical protein